MKSIIPILVVLVIVAVIAALLKSRSGSARKGTQERPKRKALMTVNETGLYNRLKQSLPDFHVFTQVSFNALITAKSYATRNTFNRKMADFVVCDQALQVVAVIELDDSSHRNKSEEDRQRDALLTAAGYRVIRYKTVPDIDRVRADFAPPATDTKKEPTFQLEEITHG